MPSQDDIDIAPVVAQHNKYLEDQTTQIREKSIPWEGYQKAGLITEDELAQIRLFEKTAPEALKETGQKFVLLFLSLLQKLVRVDTIQNILVVFEDKVLGNKDVADILKPIDANILFGTFNKLLQKDDEYIQLKAAKIFAILASERLDVFSGHDIFRWVEVRLADTNPNVVDIVIQILQTLLAVPDYRLEFYNTTGAINKNYEVIPFFIDVAKNAIKEKVVRVIFSTIKNMLILAPQENIIPMLGNKLLQLCETLSARKWSDTEITDDLTYIKEELAKNINSLSTFDEYSSEVRSGKLDWSPPHLSEQFWKQNAARLSEKDHDLAKVLTRLIVAPGSSNLVLAVAAHDIGQYVKYCPNGKKYVQESGTKTQIMQLMTHENSDVRYQALIAVQKLMANSWVS
ncbi:UNVERIFIED_CONTAM: H(+)-transporting V1 sector ATPase subunit H [Siphonaria sp. JEL0065]|nr:H(+)-transporting V1 sector ATPase subunit H [Siphonaria sp. JEL0065]